MRAAVVRPAYGAPAGVQALLPPPDPATSALLIFGTPGRCNRAPSCAKPAGHPGFCSGPRAGDSPTRQIRPQEPGGAGSPAPSEAAAAGLSSSPGRPRRSGAGRRRRPGNATGEDDDVEGRHGSIGGGDRQAHTDQIAAARLLAADELRAGMRIAKAVTRQDLHSGQVGEILLAQPLIAPSYHHHDALLY